MKSHDSKKPSASKLERWIKVAGLIATIVGIPITLLTISDRFAERSKIESRSETAAGVKMDLRGTDAGEIGQKTTPLARPLGASRNRGKAGLSREDKTAVTDVKPILSDLLVSKLGGPGRLKPLDGHPVLKLENGGNLFTGGFRAFLTFSHNTKGSHSLIVTGIQLKLIRFDPQPHAAYAYEIDSESIIGAGKVKPDVFAVPLHGNSIGPATKFIGSKPLVARSENFFDTENPAFIALRPENDPPAAVEISVTAWENGLYEVSFIIDSHVAGEDRRHETKPIFLYYWED